MSDHVHEHHSEPTVASNPEAAISATVHLTPKAIEIVRNMHAKEGLGAEQGLRVGVVGGGCSGFQYTMAFDDCKEGDIVTEFDGVKVYIDEVSMPYIAGVTLDYIEGLHNAGFRFDNPRASRTCGCGSSFSA